MATPDKLIINARELLTLQGRASPRTKEELQDLGVIQDGALAMKEDEILAVGKREEVLSQLEVKKGQTEIIDARGKVVMPGLIDPHTHLLYGGNRAEELNRRLAGTPYLTILKEGGGILQTVASTRKATNLELYRATKKRLLRMAKHGITTLEIKSGYGLTFQDEIRSLEVINKLGEGPLTVLPTFLGAHAIPREYKTDPDSYVNSIIQEMLPFVRSKGLATFCDVFCEEGVFTIDQSRAILKKAKELGFLLKIHADEMTSLGGAQLAAELGAISAEHLLKISQEGMDAMAKRGTIAVLLPGTAFYLGEEYAPARKLIQTGIPIALSTDFNPGSSPLESPWIIIGLAVLKMGMTIEEAISAFTINAAYALNLGSTHGSLEVGKKGDVLLLDMETYKEIPYYFGASKVLSVIKDGKYLY